MVPLGELVLDTQYGTSAKSNEAGLGRRVLRMNNITYDGAFDLTDVKWVELPGDETKKLQLRRGDLLFNRTNSRELVGKTGVWEGPDEFTFAGYLVRVRLREDRVLPGWISRFMNSPVGKTALFHMAKPSINMANISASDLLRLHVPVAPIDHQRRTIALLDKADAIRRKRNEAMSLTEELLRSVFLEIFGDPVTNPKGWGVKPLGEVIDKLEAGWSANGDARPREADEYGVLKISAVTSGFFRPDEYKAVARDAVDRVLVTPRAGDLLFSRANTRELVAATCLVEQDEPRLFLPDKIWRVTPRANVASAPYIRFLLAHDRFRGELTKTATGTSGSMLNVSMEKLRALRAPIPPFSTQERFARVVWKSLKGKALNQQARDKTDELFSSLVHGAFRGELTGTNGANKQQLGLFIAGGR